MIEMDMIRLIVTRRRRDRLSLTTMGVPHRVLKVLIHRRTHVASSYCSLCPYWSYWFYHSYPCTVCYYFSAFY
jgi:hypothetical protein